MKSFFGNEFIKESYLSQVIDHQKADEVIKGKYWENGKGCAVGCTIHSSDHKDYEMELGIPEWLARVEDTLFEGMSTIKSKTWAEDFLQSIPLGVDLNQIKSKFLLIVLKSTYDTFDHVKFPDVKESLDTVVNLYESGETDLDKFNSAANSAANAAANAANSAAYANANAAANYANSAAYAYAYANSAAYAYAAKYDYFADELLKLLKNCK